VPVVGDVQQAVALHSGDGLADGRTALVEPFRMRARSGTNFFFELVHGPQYISVVSMMFLWWLTDQSR